MRRCQQAPWRVLEARLSKYSALYSILDRSWQRGKSSVMEEPEWPPQLAVCTANPIDFVQWTGLVLFPERIIQSSHHRCKGTLRKLREQKAWAWYWFWDHRVSMICFPFDFVKLGKTSACLCRRLEHAFMLLCPLEVSLIQSPPGRLSLGSVAWNALTNRIRCTQDWTNSFLWREGVNRKQLHTYIIMFWRN